MKHPLQKAVERRRPRQRRMEPNVLRSVRGSINIMPVYRDNRHTAEVSNILRRFSGSSDMLDKVFEGVYLYFQDFSQ